MEHTFLMDQFPELKISGIARALASRFKLLAFEGDVINLGISGMHESLVNRTITERIEGALGEYLKKHIKIIITILK